MQDTIEHFNRRGLNLHMTLPLSQWVAILGFALLDLNTWHVDSGGQPTSALLMRLLYSFLFDISEIAMKEPLMVNNRI